MAAWTALRSARSPGRTTSSRCRATMRAPDGPRADARVAVSSAISSSSGRLLSTPVVEPAVRHPLGEVPERADLPPGKPGRAELIGCHAQQLSGGGQVTAEQVLDARDGPPGRGHRQLLARDLEQQGTEQIHRRQLGDPGPGIEIRPLVDQPRQHWIGGAQVRARSGQPRRAAGILGHRARSFLQPGSAGHRTHHYWRSGEGWSPDSDESPRPGDTWPQRLARSRYRFCP